jgi:hypothetical protein
MPQALSLLTSSTRLLSLYPSARRHGRGGLLLRPPPRRRLEQGYRARRPLGCSLSGSSSAAVDVLGGSVVTAAALLAALQLVWLRWRGARHREFQVSYVLIENLGIVESNPYSWQDYPHHGSPIRIVLYEPNPFQYPFLVLIGQRVNYYMTDSFNLRMKCDLLCLGCFLTCSHLQNLAGFTYTGQKHCK